MASGRCPLIPRAILTVASQQRHLDSKGTCVEGAAPRIPVEAPIGFYVTAREDCGNRARSRTSRHAVLSVLAAQSGAGTGIRDAAPSTQVPFAWIRKCMGARDWRNVNLGHATNM